MGTDLIEITELALASTDVAAFRRDILAWLEAEVGFDLAGLTGPSDGGWHGYDEAEAEATLGRSAEYMAELEPAHIRAALGPRPMIDTEVIPSSSRQRLGLYRDQLLPCGVSVMVVSLWANRHGAFGLHLARTGPGRRFRSREVDLVATCLPMVQLADAYVVARDRLQRPELAFEVWANGVGLTPAERRVAALVTRGLQNGEIAQLTGCSRRTVRNHLVSVFRKADVTTRSELAFVISSSDPKPSFPAWVRHLVASQ